MFTNSKRLTWFFAGTVVVLDFVALFTLGEASVPIITVSIPSMLTLVGHWTYATNKAETEHKKIGA